MKFQGLCAPLSAVPHSQNLFIVVALRPFGLGFLKVVEACLG
jgi:hypothetical protein